MIRSIIFLIFFASSISVFAQRSFFLSAESHYGFIIPHSNAIKSASNSNPYGLQLNTGYALNSAKVNEQCKCIPRVGLSFLYTNFDNKNILGNGYTISAFIEPYLTIKHKLKPLFRFASGISYLDKTYHPVHNPDNLFYSSSLSFLLQASLGIHYSLNKKTDLMGYGSFNHISNGGISLPNKGINFPTASFGLNYNFSSIEVIERSKKSILDLYGSKIKFPLTVLLGYKKADRLTSRRYTVLGLNQAVMWHTSLLNAISFHVEIMNDEAIRHIETNSSYRNVTNFSLGPGHRFLFGKFSLQQYIGFYIQKPLEHYTPEFHRWTLDYEILTNLHAGLSMKAHRQVADALFFNIEYQFRKKI